MVKSVGLGGDCVGMRDDSGDIISGEACWEQLSSLHALKFDIGKDGASSR